MARRPRPASVADIEARLLAGERPCNVARALAGQHLVVVRPLRAELDAQIAADQRLLAVAHRLRVIGSEIAETEGLPFNTTKAEQ